MAQQPEGEHIFWTGLKTALMVLAAGISLTYAPENLKDIWIISVLAPAGLGLIIADTIRVLWVQHRGPQSRQEDFDVFALNGIIVMVALLAFIPCARLWDGVQRLRRSI